MSYKINEKTFKKFKDFGADSDVKNYIFKNNVIQKSEVFLVFIS